VPNGNTDGWRLATQSCGGFSCNEFQAGSASQFARRCYGFETVAEEEFSPAPLDYFNMMDAADAAAVKKGTRHVFTARGFPAVSIICHS
jgi:hypothetical protein